MNPTTEPVALNQALVVVLSAIVAALWGVVDVTWVNAAASLVALGISILTTRAARAKVTPLARPKDEHGVPLVTINPRLPSTGE